MLSVHQVGNFPLSCLAHFRRYSIEGALASLVPPSLDALLMRESVNVSAAGGPVPATDWKPADVTPDLEKSMAKETLDASRVRRLPAELDSNQSE